MSPRRRAPRPKSGWDAEPPKAVLMVDRRVIRDRLRAAVAKAGLAVVCIDGTPRALVQWLAHRFGEGLHVPVLYLHDAATVIYPFAVEPLASLVKRRAGQPDDAPLPYRDLGLPPLGASARRFGDDALRGDEPIRDLDSIPPATLARYCEAAIYLPSLAP